MADLNIPVGALLDHEGPDPSTGELPHAIAILPDGHWVEYNRLPEGQIGRRVIEPVKSGATCRWYRWDFSKLRPNQPYPWQVPWNNYGFYGHLSGGGGVATIHQDGRIELNQEWIS